MSVQCLTTDIWLPPGTLKRTTVETFFRKVFEEYRWFRPLRFGGGSLDKRLDSALIDYNALIDHYERHQSITVAARTDRDFIFLYCAQSAARPYIGSISWDTAAKEAAKPAWRQAHQRQIVELMRLLDAPLAVTALAADLERKTRRLVPNPDGFGSTQESTIRGYGEGLAGLFWRNFFGAPFVQMFGERLDTLPGEFKQDLGDGTVLVQPYELPTQTGTPEGVARERQIITHLGPECFYDHERHLKPTRLPDLPAPLLH
jgi:hypothetical protein